ncbi:MAG TPA: FAD:protein FMN transferase [Roseiarcus sp.]|nr:FAD:protein FMN transferase [Roseiarcus sp.]
MTWTAPMTSRRHVLTLFGAAAGLPLLCARDNALVNASLFRWDGTSLGSPSRLLLYHRDRSAALRIVARCVDEIERLERIFALYRADSELARLNRDGRLETPSIELLSVLSLSQHLSALSGGAFDVTVQPLWDLYARHFFATAAPAPEGPDPDAIESALRLVDCRGIDLEPRRVVLARPGMGVTLNGIAQGYVADRLIEILRGHSCDGILADLGRSEMRALGSHPGGRPWRVGLADPRCPEALAATLELRDDALCTSGGYGTKFEPSGRFHHLFNPATGRSASRYIGVSVVAPRAMIADALSTALYVASPDRHPQMLGAFPGVAARLTLADGSVRHL